MKTVKTLALALTVVCAAAVALRADDKKPDAKEVTLQGTLLCSKCALGQTADCGTALLVKDGDKTVTYFVKDEGKAAPYHGKFCTAGKKGVAGSVTGVVSEEKDKHYITPSPDGVKFD